MNRYSRVFFLLIFLLLTVFMIINPRETVKAAQSGFELWYSILVPALLPFFIVAELLVNMGFARFLGVLLEPVMRPLFKLPGASSLVVAMGFTSGFPIGAVLTRKLYDEKMLSANEAERLVSFTNNSSPLFILGAVGVGMFNSPMIGCLLAISHYLANIIVGLLWGIKERHTGIPLSPGPSAPGLLSAAFNALLVYSENINTSPGKLLGDSIKNAINNILAIAGFVIIFSVLTRMLSVWGFMEYIAYFIQVLLSVLNIPYQIAYGMGMGMFEITIGSKTITSATDGDLLLKMLAVSIVLGFSGFSVIAQVLGIMAGTPVRLSFYLVSRLLQMSIASIITCIGYHLLKVGQHSLPAISLPFYKIIYSVHAWHISLICIFIALSILLIMSLFSLLRQHT